MSLKTEKQKMLAGEMYNIFDPELDADRQKCKKLFQRFNLTALGPERTEILRELFGHFGNDSLIEPPFFCSYGQNTYIGNHVFLNHMCVIFDNNDVIIGDHVMIGPSVHLYTAAHHIQAEPRNRGMEVAKSIVIEDNVWIGGSVVILPGVTVKRNAVVGAGSVVSRDVPESTVVVGNPARVIREIDQ